jgi:hypothetical protein
MIDADTLAASTEVAPAREVTSTEAAVDATPAQAKAAPKKNSAPKKATPVRPVPPKAVVAKLVPAKAPKTQPGGTHDCGERRRHRGRCRWPPAFANSLTRRNLCSTTTRSGDRSTRIWT